MWTRLISKFEEYFTGGINVCTENLIRGTKKMAKSSILTWLAFGIWRKHVTSVPVLRCTTRLFETEYFLGSRMRRPGNGNFRNESSTWRSVWYLLNPTKRHGKIICTKRVLNGKNLLDPRLTKERTSSLQSSNTNSAHNPTFRRKSFVPRGVKDAVRAKKWITGRVRNSVPWMTKYSQ